MASDADGKAVEAFEDEVIDRLFVLNAQRAEEERKAGAVVGAKRKGAGPGARGARGSSTGTKADQ